MELHINVANKVATYQQRDGDIICGNTGPTGYTVRFVFDAEWGDVADKTARFIWNGTYADMLIVDGVCAVPMMRNTDRVAVGVYGGDLCTTTPAIIPCQKSILCSDPVVSTESGEYYESICLTAAREAAESAEDAETSAQAATASAGAAQASAQSAAYSVERIADLLDSFDPTIITFDLTSLGLPTVVLDGEAQTLQTDTTAIMAALANGAVKFGLTASMGSEMPVTIVVTPLGMANGAQYLCTGVADVGDVSVLYTVMVQSGAVSVWMRSMESGSGLPEVTTADNGKFLQVVDGAWAAVALTDVSVEGA